jgi:indole-3-glycerol phosphate synthase
MAKSTLEEILAATRSTIDALRGHAPELERRAQAAPPPLPFDSAFEGGTVAVVAEVKRRSPSAGVIREDLDPVSHAEAYARGGAAAISVLTDGPHFGGSLSDLDRVARAVRRPVLRKDFILDELQLLEARAHGASAVLLIVRALPTRRLRDLAKAAHGLGLGTLVEVHTETEVEAALAVAPTAVGVNSRDLATFTVDAVTALRLIAHIPSGVTAVAESGIATRDDVVRAAAAGADGVLVGTAVARAADPAGAVRVLTGVERRGRG